MQIIRCHIQFVTVISEFDSDGDMTYNVFGGTLNPTLLVMAEPYEGQTYDSYVSFEAVIMLVMITDRPPVLQHTMLHKLEWEPLQQQPACSRVGLWMFYRILNNGLAAIPTAPYLNPTLVHTRGHETRYTQMHCNTSQHTASFRVF